jgi:hypothetical protein
MLSNEERNDEGAIRYAEIMVREAGFNYEMIAQTRGATLRRGNSTFDYENIVSRSFALYECAKSILWAVDPDNAEAFIKSTYGYGVKNNG